MGGPGGRWSIARAAVLVAGLTAVSTVLGFVRDVVIGAVFGAGAQLDAWFVAQGVMNVVLGLIAWAMARSVTPVTAREAARERAEGTGCRGHRGFEVSLTLTVLVLGLAGVVVGLLAAPVTSLLAPGFDDAQTATTAALTRIVLVATVLVAGTDLLASLAQAHGRFAWSSLQGVPFNLVMIAAAGVFGPRYGITALAVGYVAGSAARLLMQLPPVLALGARIRPRWELRDPGFREIVRLVPPMLVGNAVVNVNTLVDRAVGSTLGDGAISALSYGWRLVDLPETLVIAALLAPLYPALGAAADDRPELRRLVDRGLSVVVTVLTPICTVFVVAAAPLVATAFGHGAFDAGDVRATATAVAWYAPALLALGCRQVVVRASYALGDSRGPVVVAVLAMVVNVAGDLVLAPLMGLAGIAAATTASLAVAALLNAGLLHRRHAGLDPRSAAGLLGRALLLAAVAGGAGLGVREALPVLPPIVLAVVLAAVVGGTYLLGLAALRAPERRLLGEVLGAVLRRR
ncbi:murein biosynthesis integral membrane protein MurJ [Kocuria sp. CNJ-770]|uniref:Murein biosynthesis integral membrane protein MurJ n=1 Tax=Kocuria oceani TaxID=988827 RepID=A0ABV9TDM7_9MICC|nr:MULTISPECIES: murein biosynthesis integral membrane protein MurJ [Kocuria]OLT09425.1 murein biosynthesis integral membrane protein MurJ [Kocuria sp. CNJ-770]